MENACGDDLALYRYYKNDWQGIGQDDPFSGRDSHFLTSMWFFCCSLANKALVVT